MRLWESSPEQLRQRLGGHLVLVVAAIAVGIGGWFVPVEPLPETARALLGLAGVAAAGVAKPVYRLVRPLRPTVDIDAVGIVPDRSHVTAVGDTANIWVELQINNIETAQASAVISLAVLEWRTYPLFGVPRTMMVIPLCSWVNHPGGDANSLPLDPRAGGPFTLSFGDTLRPRLEDPPKHSKLRLRVEIGGRKVAMDVATAEMNQWPMGWDLTPSTPRLPHERMALT